MAQDLKRINDNEGAGWSSEVDTLLVFAALFSAVVTGLMVEQLKSLEEDPAETTATILKNLIEGNSLVPPQPKPTTTDVAINTLWSLSLIISLSSALFGLLCKQWIREHRRDVESCSHAESVALLWARRESLRKWHIPSILAALPLLLQISLILFFAGLLLLLNARHIVPFVLSMAAVGLTVSFYIVTAVMPAAALFQCAISIVKQNPNANILEKLSPVQFVCPYKSPQASIIFTLSRFLLRTSFVKHMLYSLLSGRYGFGTFQDTLDQNLLRLSDWPSLDLYIIRSFDDIHPDIPAPPVYELQGLRWIVKTFTEIPALARHVQNILGTLPPHLVPLVAKTSLDQWKLPTWQTLSPDDLKIASETPPPYFSSERREAGLDPHTGDAHPPIGSPLLTQLLFYQYSWDLPGNKDWDSLYNLTEQLYALKIPKLSNIPFVVPFHQVEQLLIAPPPVEQPPGNVSISEKQQLGLRFLTFYEEGWRIASTLVDSEHHDQLALVKAVIKHLSTTTGRDRSALVTSSVGFNFIKFVHNGIVDGRLYDNGHWKFVDIVPAWKERVVERVKALRSARGLPVGENDFRNIPLGT
ncbi:hypothetical protein L218DRAFT_992038 [Marasmius fiardii PR-910]|nr:hypothetical protein L218DRAFT_992038 [Marasmius fiardii PR-910]